MAAAPSEPVIGRGDVDVRGDGARWRSQTAPSPGSAPRTRLAQTSRPLRRLRSLRVGENGPMENQDQPAGDGAHWMALAGGIDGSPRGAAYASRFAGIGACIPAGRLTTD